MNCYLWGCDPVRPRTSPSSVKKLIRRLRTLRSVPLVMAWLRKATHGLEVCLEADRGKVSRNAVILMSEFRIASADLHIFLAES